MVMGTVAGAGLGYAAAMLVCDKSGESLCEWGAARGALWGAAIGWAVGGVVGAHWKMRLPGLPQLAVVVSPVMIGTRGAAFSVAIR
jgi:hypothetical protein